MIGKKFLKMLLDMVLVMQVKQDIHGLNLGKKQEFLQE